MKTNPRLSEEEPISRLQILKRKLNSFPNSSFGIVCRSVVCWSIISWFWCRRSSGQEVGQRTIDHGEVCFDYSMTFGVQLDRVRGDHDRAISVFPHKGSQWKIKARSWALNHQWRTDVWVAKEEHPVRSELKVNTRSVSSVIDHHEQVRWRRIDSADKTIKRGFEICIAHNGRQATVIDERFRTRFGDRLIRTGSRLGNCTKGSSNRVELRKAFDSVTVGEEGRIVEANKDLTIRLNHLKANWQIDSHQRVCRNQWGSDIRVAEDHNGVGVKFEIDALGIRSVINNPSNLQVRIRIDGVHKCVQGVIKALGALGEHHAFDCRRCCIGCCVFDDAAFEEWTYSGDGVERLANTDRDSSYSLVRSNATRTIGTNRGSSSGLDTNNVLEEIGVKTNNTRWVIG